MNIKRELRKYINKNLVRDNLERKDVIEFMLLPSDRRLREAEEACLSIDEYIEENIDYSSFQETLFKLIDERNLKDSDVYNKVNIDRRLFSKIRNDKYYHPSKETIILLGLSLELNEIELDNLLSTASYSLPKNNHFDLIIRFCFINKIYNPIEINELLNDYNCKLLIKE